MVGDFFADFRVELFGLMSSCVSSFCWVKTLLLAGRSKFRHVGFLLVEFVVVFFSRPHASCFVWSYLFIYFCFTFSSVGHVFLVLFLENVLIRRASAIMFQPRRPFHAWG